MSNNKKKNKNKDNVNKKKRETFNAFYFLIAFLAALVFVFIYGFRVLNTSEVGWLFASNGDIMQHYVGWEAFRFGEWTFPFGLTNTVSYPIDISVIYTDSIPILALFFKLISFMLPKTFQYLGWYGLICFVLQAVISAKIIKKFTNSKLIIIAVSLLFTIIPSMIFRMFYHTALASHWLILLSLETIFLYDDFNNDNKRIYYIWSLISFLVASIHIYYLLMCGIILVGYIVFDILNTKKVKKSLILLGLYILIALLTIWLFGGFTNLSGDDDFGFGLGLFSYNLNGLVNPQGWSVFIDPLPMLGEQYEGFSYLGLGVIILIVIAIILTIIWGIKDRETIKKYKNLLISLSVISFISIFVAASPVVYFGEHLIYDLNLPKFIINLWEVFRSSGRIVWPVIHILTLLSVIVIIKRLNWQYALFILMICTCIQVLDIGGMLSDIHSFHMQTYEINEEYDIYSNEALKLVAKNENIKLLVIVDSGDLYDTDKIMYSDWALNNGIKTNNFHFARTSFNEMLFNNTISLLENIDESKAYVFTSSSECQSLGLNCYNLPNHYSLGYVNELN